MAHLEFREMGAGVLGPQKLKPFC